MPGGGTATAGVRAWGVGLVRMPQTRLPMSRTYAITAVVNARQNMVVGPRFGWQLPWMPHRYCTMAISDEISATPRQTTVEKRRDSARASVVIVPIASLAIRHAASAATATKKQQHAFPNTHMFRSR